VAPYAGRNTILDSLAEEQPSARTATPDQVLDLSLVQQLEASGFVDQLYAQRP
jgi:hypothetical protein